MSLRCPAVSFVAVAALALQLPVSGQQTASAPARRTLGQICKQLARDYGLRVTWKARDIPKCTWKIRYQPAKPTELRTLREYMELFDHEFRKYPKAFVKASKLRGLAFVGGLSIAGQTRSALPDYVQENLYYDFRIGARRADAYAQHVIHHEYFHMLEEEWNGSAYFKDPEWAKLNPKKFHYGAGGAAARNPSVTTLRRPRPGFVNGYAMSGLEEDKAEVWALLFVPREWRLLAKWRLGDKILANKVLFLERFALAKCKHMNERYWTQVRRVRRKPPK